MQDVAYTEKNGTSLLKNISFDIHDGEIFGIAGVSGNGQDELCDVLCGLRKSSSGQIFFGEKDVTHLSIRKHNEAGLGYVPLDRYRDGMIMDMTLAENILLKGNYDAKWFRHGFIREKALKAYTEDIIKRHRVKATGADDLAGSLSGGNQQKVVLGREVDIGTRILIFNQPTRGLDMGAVDRIHHVMMEEKKKGKAILLISTELNELFEMCDRIAIMHSGEIMGIYKNGELSTEAIGLLMAGVKTKEEEK